MNLRFYLNLNQVQFQFNQNAYKHSRIIILNYNLWFKQKLDYQIN